MNRRALILAGLSAMSLLGCKSISQWPHSNPFTHRATPTLPPAASFEQIAAVINANTARVRTLYAPQARIRSPMAPALRSTIALERPQRFRLQAKIMNNTEVDFGSNDDLFWFWTRRGDPPALVYGRHDQLSQSAAQRFVPIDASRLPDVFGLVEFASQDEHSSPIPVAGAQVKISTRRPSDPNSLIRVVVFDTARAVVNAVHVYDSREQRVASASLSGHRQDRTSGAMLPAKIQIDWPQHGAEFTIDLGDVDVNAAASDISPSMWEMPQIDAAPQVNLADPGAVDRLLNPQP